MLIFHLTSSGTLLEDFKFDLQFYQYDIKRFKQAIIVISMVVVIIIDITVTIGVYLHFERSWVLNCN